ncbi:MAG: hypothetical protein HW405_193 [Candidatus Berkelbacteria bacterium]|nr:hypothetical protein [Candidatus Berkelbacteria bacterium]
MRGTVKTNNGKAVKDAEVFVENVSTNSYKDCRTDLTDFDGSYVIDNAVPGYTRALADKLAGNVRGFSTCLYQTQIQYFDLPDGGEVTINFVGDFRDKNGRLCGPSAQ